MKGNEQNNASQERPKGPEETLRYWGYHFLVGLLVWLVTLALHHLALAILYLLFS